ncbi:hypothetical protein [Mesorhizobium sp. AR07]|nr:hypothetical protein [Mesorhizobium sp. AR07]
MVEIPGTAYSATRPGRAKVLYTLILRMTSKIELDFEHARGG